MQARIIRPDPATEFFTEERCHILECLNAPDSPFSIAQARVEPGVITALHALRGVDEVYYLLTGTGEMEVGNTLKASVGPGDVVCIPAGVSQRIRNTGMTDLVFLCVCTPRFEVACYEDLE
ncbi:MAG: cupin domain-containing protein [Bacteroidota bacterium]